MAMTFSYVKERGLVILNVESTRESATSTVTVTWFNGASRTDGG